MGVARRVIGGGAATVLLAVGAVAFVASSASAQIQTLVVDGDLISFTENVWDVTIGTDPNPGPGAPCVSDPLVDAVSIEGDPVTIVDQVEVDNTTTRVTLPQDAPAGEITWEMSCVITAGLTSGTGIDLYAVIDPETLEFEVPANFDATITNELVVPEPVVVTPTFTG